MPSYSLGLDIGQVQDPAALAILERLDERTPDGWVYHLRHLERPQLGTSYGGIVSLVAARMAHPSLLGAPLIIDRTGVGRPVVEMFREAGLAPVAVTITGGQQAKQDPDNWRDWSVPKRDLVGALQVLFQSGRLKVAAGLPLAATFTKELLNFKMKINLQTGHDSYEAWREGQHDDLVLAVALAVWYAEVGAGYMPVLAHGGASGWNPSRR